MDPRPMVRVMVRRTAHSFRPLFSRRLFVVGLNFVRFFHWFKRFFQCKIEKRASRHFYMYFYGRPQQKIYSVNLLTKSYCLRNWVPQVSFKPQDYLFKAHSPKTCLQLQIPCIRRGHDYGMQQTGRAMVPYLGGSLRGDRVNRVSR